MLLAVVSNYVQAFVQSHVLVPLAAVISNALLQCRRTVVKDEFVWV